LPARYVDPEKSIGNLAPGATLFGEPYVEQIDGRAYDYGDELGRIRQIWAREAASARASRPSAPSFKTRTLRRG
jgi:hypothetical protein